ncbi:MAG: tripartite tricarboxylate transporter substrate binding protein [Burkholderiales bacterium]|uniref:Bug family tripartite tricarboxylate transporter substrate binding protein n=1 Tax=Casimicrobium huifangae TaxID=2591109 RepID=UPI0012EC8B5F|nr:tripartite tricarboxylate transporter substrate binding protein [Casimicrobium huifangae]
MNKPNTTRRQLIKALAAAPLAGSGALWAQGTWPQGPVKIVVGFPPGGGTDALARVLAPKLTTMWGQQVIVENRAGVAGVLAADVVAKSTDGLTLLMGHINSHGIGPALNPKMPYNAETDFSPLALVGVTPNVLICHPNAPAKTLKDIVALAKAKPGTLSFGSAGSGSAQHLALELFKVAAGVDVLHVPYKGSAPLLTDLMGGQINYSFDTMAAVTPHVKGGKVHAVAQTRTKRSASYPDLPTVAESGYPGFEATTWYGMIGPARMASDLVQRINRDINTAMAMPDVKERLNAVGAEDGGGTAQQFADFMRAERVKWARVVKEANVKVDA